MKRSRKVLIIAALFIVGLLAFFIGRSLLSAPLAPAVSFTLLSGEKINLTALRGKVAIVHFWATSCTTCVKEMPQWVRLYEQFNQPASESRLEFIAVAMFYDPPMYVSHFSATRQLPFKVAMDSDGALARAFGQVQLTPTTFVIDRHGHIVKQYLGEPDWVSLQKLLDDNLVERI